MTKKLRTRTVPLTRTRAKGEDAIRATLSSEEAVRWPDCFEILDHSPTAVDLSRARGGRLPLLENHDLAAMPRLGNVERIHLAARRLVGYLRFGSSERAQELRRAVLEGTADAISIGYRVLKSVRIGTDRETGLPIVRGTRWQLLEVSLVNVGKDATVGVGRSLLDVDARGDDHMPMKKNSEASAAGAAAAAGGAELPYLERAERMRHNRILQSSNELLTEHAGKHPRMAAAINDLTQRALRDGSTLEEFHDRVGPAILDIMASAQRQRGFSVASSEQIDALSGLNTQDRSRFSLQRAIGMAEERRLGRRERFDGLEGEVHQELLRQRGSGVPDHGGICVPWRTRSTEEDYRARAMGTMEPTGGATLVGQTVMPDLIDVLRNRAMVLVSGARLFPGLQGSVFFNKAHADPTVSWIGENPSVGASTSEPAFGYVTMNAKTAIGRARFPRQLLVQASIDAETDLRNRLGAAHALKFDLAALHGKGTESEPHGLWTTEGVLTHSVDGVPGLTDITVMPAKVADQNADVGALAWMTTPLMAGVLMRTPIVAGQPLFVWTGTFQEGRIGGYRAGATNQMSKTLGAGEDEHGLVFGNWNDLALGIWGNELEIVVDVVTEADKAQIVVTSYSMVDCAVLRGESFVKGTGAIISEGEA